MRKSKIFLGLTIGTFLLCSTAASNVKLANDILETGNTVQLRKDNTFSETAKTKDNRTYEPFSGAETDELNVTLHSFNRTDRTCSIEFRVAINAESEQTTDGEANYYIGYYPETGDTYPASLEYKVVSKSGKSYYSSTEINRVSNHGIGNSLGSANFSSYCDVELPYDCEIDVDSVRLINVYRVNVVKDPETGLITSRLPDLKAPRAAKTSKYQTFKNTDLSKFLDFTIGKFSEYGDFTAVAINVTNTGTEKYPSLSTSIKRIYEQNKDKIDDGTVYVRTRLAFGGDTKFIITDKEGKVTEQKSIATSVNLSNDTNKAVFLVEGLDANNISNFQLYAPTFNIELFNTETSKVVPRSNFSARLGYVDFKMQDVLNENGTVGLEKATDVSKTSYTLIYSIVLAVFVVCFIAADIAYFFYLKNKDKKSDFKVLKLGDFIKNSIFAIICLGSLIFDILYIATRSGDFNNSIAVYNPLDWVIVVLSIIVICLGGYFIKYFYVSIKNANEKKRRDRLNLNKDQADDGTGLVKIHK